MRSAFVVRLDGKPHRHGAAETALEVEHYPAAQEVEDTARVVVAGPG